MLLEVDLSDRRPADVTRRAEPAVDPVGLLVGGARLAQLEAALELGVDGGGPLPSLILWGPPGTGKTTLARLLTGRAGTRFIPLSAVLSGVKATPATQTTPAKK